MIRLERIGLLITILLSLITRTVLAQELKTLSKPAREFIMERSGSENGVIYFDDSKGSGVVQFYQKKHIGQGSESLKFQKAKIVRRNSFESEFRYVKEVFTPNQVKKTEEDKLKFEGKFTYVEKANIYSLRPKVEYHPVEKIGFEFMILMNWPNDNGFRVHQIERNYFIKMSFNF